MSDIRLVDGLFKLKKQSGSSPWPVVDACLKYWKEQSPSSYKSFLFNIQETRETRKDQKFGSTTDKSTGATLRYTLDIPEKVAYMLRIIYTPDELPMNREFYIEFAKRYPEFKVADKI